LQAKCVPLVFIGGFVRDSRPIRTSMAGMLLVLCSRIVHFLRTMVYVVNLNAISAHGLHLSG
jgi:hypothetical protein